MNAVVNRDSQTKLAKLLAKENIQVAIGNYTTAFFDVKNRVLGLPAWNTTNKYVSDLLIGHEVGHALHTPENAITRFKEELPGVPFDIGNIVEDVRIERLIKSNYPGLVFSFKEGYSHFVKNDFFKINGLDLATLGFADRLNIHAKIGDFVDVPMNNDEAAIYNRCFNAETYDDVLEICKDIAKMIKEEKPKNKQKTKKAPENSEKSPSSGGESSESKDSEESEDSQNANSSQQSNSKSDDESNSKSNDSSNTSEENSDDESDNTSKAESDNKSEEKSEEKSDKTTSDSSPSHENSQSADNKLAEELISKTIKSVDENIKALQDDDNKNIIANPPFLKDMMSSIIPVEEIMRDRRQTHPECYNAVMNSVVFNEEWKAFKNNTKKSISILVKEFDRRKAAYQYSRAKQSRSGSIDINRLYSYKYEDQIFKSVTTLADAKSHGMIFFIDYSGSMRNTLDRVIDQTLQLVYFCKAVGIPFDVYGFTTLDMYGSTQESSNRLPGYNMSFDDVKILHLLSSKLNKNDFDLACRELRGQSQRYHKLAQHYSGHRFPLNGVHEQFGGTPLVETVIVAHEIIKKFKAQHQIQKLNVIFLTDGDERPVQFTKNTVGLNYEKPMSYVYGGPDATKIKVKIEGKTLNFAIRNSRNMYASVIENLKSTCGVTAIGFFIADHKSAYSKHCISAIQNSASNKGISWSDACAKFKSIQRSSKKDKCASIDNGFNFNSYFVFESKNDLAIDEETEFEIDSIDDTSVLSSQTKIAKAFTKYTSEKRLSRVFLDKFTKTIA